MNKIQFKCILESDVIINQNAATEGNQQTLDFIPGSAFLGIAARSLYIREDSETFILFHSGKVRFSDAHPFQIGKKAFRVPAAWYHLKGGKMSEGVYMDVDELPSDGKVQFKQCRSGFLVKISDKEYLEVGTVKNFAIKSAYDSEKRRSKDEKMYGYQSLEAGSEWCFEITFDDDVDACLIKKLKNALTGVKTIGRSKTAQYGLINISEAEFSLDLKEVKPPSGYDYVFADSRLIFIDRNGVPTLIPDPSMLGFMEGEIDWSKSSVRTFRYAPFNSHRRTRDIDRTGIEKGSVFCVKNGGTIDPQAIQRGVGCYLAEGFGKILVNPEFLVYDSITHKAGFTVSEKQKEPDAKMGILPPEPVIALNPMDKLVYYFIRNSYLKEKDQIRIYKLVNEFVENSEKDRLFKNESFASQWGTIRAIATKIKDKNSLYSELFDVPTREEKEKNKNTKEGYLMHGVAKDKWSKKGRLNRLKEFIKSLDDQPEMVSEAVINLASEMAKKCKKGG